MDKEIEVKYISGIERSEFQDLENLGYTVNIPKDLKQQVFMAFDGKPEDYMVVFTIYFSLKVVDELAAGIAKKLVSNFTETVKGVWDKFKNLKPAILRSEEEPEYKLPKAILSFKISENESSTLEITNEISEDELKQLLETQLKLIKMQYKHRKKELELRLNSKKKK